MRVEELFRNVRWNRDKKSFVACCELHNDSRPSLSVNLEKGLYYCFTCDIGGKLRGYFQRRGYEVIPSLLMEEQLMDMYSNSNNDKDACDDLFSEQEVVRLPDYNAESSYLFDRGFTLSTIEKWNLGFNLERRSLIIPIYDEYGKYRGFQERFLCPGQLGGKYKTYCRKSDLLFGLDKVADRFNWVVVTEGALDCIWLDQWGFPAVAILGSFLSERQKDLLKTFKEIKILLDFDKVGLAKAYKISKQLENISRIKNCTRYWPKLSGKDPQELTVQELKEVLGLHIEGGRYESIKKRTRTS